MAVEIGKISGECVRFENLAFICEVILVVLVEFGRGRIECECDIFAWRVTCCFDGFYDEADCLFG